MAKYDTILKEVRMDTNFNTPVVGQEIPGAEAPLAAGTGGALQGGVATPNPKDEDVQKRIDEALKKSEDDIRKLKSSFDRREAIRLQEMEKREAEFNRKLEELSVRGMDEATRKKYEEEHKTSEVQRLAQEKQTLQNQLIDQQNAQTYEKFFLAQGVSSEQLITDQGVEALVESGWKGITNLVAKLKADLAKASAGPAKNDGVQLPEPVDTVIHNSNAPAKSSIFEAAKKYAGGSEDLLYTMIEKGTLSKSVLNLPKEE